MNKIVFNIVLIFFGILYFNVINVFACSCRINPFVNERFQDAANIFVGTVKETTTVSEKYGKKSPQSVEKFKFKVSENIKGKMPEEVFAYYDKNEACPDYYFHTGKTYLIYARKKDGNKFYVSGCSGTDLLERTKREIQYVRELNLGRKVSSVFGKFDKYNYDKEGKDTPLENVKVILATKGGKKFETFTDNEGIYFFDNLPLSEFKLEFDVPDDLWTRDDLRFKLDKLPYVFEINQSALSNGRISGRVFNADGTPLKNKSLSVWEIDRWISVPLTNTDTDENGNFTFNGLPEARYTIFYFLPDSFLPYNQKSNWYYLGGTFEKKDAKIILLKSAEHIENIEFRLLAEPPQIKGIITDENGKIIEEAKVFLQYSNSSGLNEKRINGWKGTFSFPIFDGYKYKLYAAITYGKFEGLKSEIIEISKNDVGKKLKLTIKTN